MAPCYGWDSTASRLQSHYEEALYFLPLMLPSVLSVLKKLLSTIFQFSRIDSKFGCDVLCDLVPFVQIKKREKHSSTDVFHVFKIVQMVPNCAKHHCLSRLCVEHKWFEKGIGYTPP